jgi:hypothetical protein
MEYDGRVARDRPPLEPEPLVQLLDKRADGEKWIGQTGAIHE